MKKVIIGVCGSRRQGRSLFINSMKDKMIIAGVKGIDDSTVSESVRVPWGRAGALADRVTSALGDSDVSVIIAGIKNLEEAQVIWDVGGYVVHFEGPPSEEIPIKRDTIMITLGDPRNRYVSVNTALTQMGVIK